MLIERMEMLEMDPSFAERHVNAGFSGGEKKRNEILQMAVLKPKLALMDETDSGLDIDALQIVAAGVNKLAEENPDMTVLLITHYQRLLNFIKPHHVHVMVEGRIVESGGPEVAIELESEGYKSWTRPRGRGRPHLRRRRLRNQEGQLPCRRTKSSRTWTSTSTSTTSSPAESPSSRPRRASRKRWSGRSPRTRTSPSGCSSSASRR